MNKQISVLLPGSFFEEDYHRKVSYLSKNKITRVYLFDHSLNPADDHKAVYEAKKALSVLLEDQDSNFDLGLCVLNINSRKIDLLFSRFINPMLDIQNFSLGLGTGDNKYENNHVKYSHDIDLIIDNLIRDYDLSLDGTNLFLGGTSQQKINLVKKYSVGINQWLGNSKDLISIYQKTYNPKTFIGRFSQCLKIDNKSMDLPDDIEKIFILKDSNVMNFYSQIDKILS